MYIYITISQLLGGSYFVFCPTNVSTDPPLSSFGLKASTGHSQWLGDIRRGALFDAGTQQALVHASGQVTYQHWPVISNS